MKYITLFIVASILVGCSTNNLSRKQPDTSNPLSINYYALGEAAYLEQDMDSAIAFFKKADTADPNNVQIKERLLETLAIASYQEESYKSEILQLGEKYYQQNIYTPRMLFILADAFRLQQMYQKADEYYLLGIKQAPTMQVLLHYYKFRENYFPPADKKWLEKAMKMPWKNRDEVLLLGELYGRINPEKGLEILNEAYEKWDDEKSMGLLLSAFDKNGENNKVLDLIQNRINENKPVKNPIKAFLITRYFAQEKYEQVINLQQECFEIGSEDVLKALFFSAINNNQYEVGIKAGLALEALKTIPAEMMTSFYSYLAKLYFDSEQIDKTLEYLVKTDDLKSVTNFVFQYDFESDEQLTEKIILLLEKYKKTTQNTNETAYLLALIYSHNADQEKAVATLDSVNIDYLKENKLLLSAAAVYLQNTSDIQKARDLIELDTDQEYSVNEILSSLLYGSQQDSLAFELCRQELNENEKPAAATFLRYSLLAEKFDTQSNMVTITKRGLDLYPENVDLMNAVGYLIADLQIEDEYELSLKLLEEAVQLAPDSEMVWDSLAWIYFRLGRFDDALQAMELPLSKEINNSEIAYHLGEIYLKLNNHSEAEKYLNLAIEINDDDDSVNQAEKLLKKIFKE